MRSITAFVSSALLSRGRLSISSSSSSSSSLAAGASIQEFHYWQYVSANSIQLATSSSLSVPSSTTTSFEPILPDTSTLIGFGILTILCVICALVWSNEVVPVSRSKLAISKSRGQVKEYLDDLKEAAASASAVAADSSSTSTTTTTNDSSSSRAFERWLMTDWLTDNKSRKQPAIPILKRAKWNSGDNPVVVTAAMMMVGIVIASVTERIVR
jgi:hypothetical protein